MVSLRDGKRIAEMELDSAGLRQLVKLKSKVLQPLGLIRPLTPPWLRPLTFLVTRHLFTVRHALCRSSPT